jgi:hypothetical protein
MTEHEEHADRLERELDDMQEQGERVEAHIEEARRDWAAKKGDRTVPGAAGDPERAEVGLPPEADEPRPD